MKKVALMCCIALALPIIIFCMTACQRDKVDTPDVLSPAIMINGVIYYSQGKVLETAPQEDAPSGHVTSVVSEKSRPSKNEEANFQCLYAPYHIVDEGVAVWFNEKWMLFEKLEDKI